MEEHSNKLHITINRDYSSSDSETSVSLTPSLLLGIMEFFCVLMVSIGSISCLLDILNPIVSMNGSIFRLCFLWSLCFTILFHLNRPRLYAAISLLLLTIYLFLNYQLIILGCKYFLTLAVDGINPYFFVNLPSFPVYPPSKDGFVLLINCIIFLLILLFSYTLVCHKKTIYIIVIAIFIPLMGLMIGILPDKTNLFLSILSLFFTIPLGSRGNFYGRGNSAVYAICCGICMFLTLFSLPMAHWIGGKTSPSLLQHHSELINAEKAVEASIISGSWYYDLFLSGSFSLFSSPPGTLNNNSPNFSGIPIMEITLDTAPTQALYLKDWVGGNYNNNAWSSISEENFAKVSEKFPLETKEDTARRVHNISYKHFQAIDPYASYSFESKQENTMTVTKLQNTMSEIPFPYFCKIPTAAIPVADGYYSKETPFESITYQGYPLENIFSNYNLITLNIAYYTVSLGVLPTPKPEENDSILEKTYQNYVRQEYLSVPEEGLTRIKDLCDAAKSELTKNNKIDTTLAIDFVTNYLSEHAAYSISLSKAPSQSDILDYFLFEQKKGFCIHFASTATLMFRMLGIPSRYVTGYLIPETVFKQQDNPNEYKAVVKDNFAHAWPEIYVKGIGWIPIESTPGNSRSGADWPLASQKPASAPTPAVPNQKPENRPTVTPPVKEHISPTPDKSTSSGHTESTAAKFQIPRWLINTLGCFLCIVFVLLAIIFRRKFIISKRMKLIYQNDTKKAVESICFEVYRLIKFENHMPLDFKNDAEYAQFIQNAIPCFNKNDFILFSAICEKALFSKNGIPESELSFCQTIYDKLQAYEMNRIKQNKSKLSYLWIKYFIIL